MAAPILKNASASSLERATSSLNKPLQWDEDNLGENQAYLDSTTRQKIDEPKTPYNWADGARSAPRPPPAIRPALNVRCRRAPSPRRHGAAR